MDEEIKRRLKHDDHDISAKQYRKLIDEGKYSLAYQLFQREKGELILNLPVWEILDDYSLFKTKLGKKEADDFRSVTIKTIEDNFDNPITDMLNERLNP